MFGGMKKQEFERIFLNSFVLNVGVIYNRYVRYLAVLFHGRKFRTAGG
jgi:hypothetical protein